MSEIAEYQSRITAALDRISQVLDNLAGAAGDEDMAAALEAERTANAQLEERVRAIKDKQETTVAALETTVSELREELQSLKGALADRDGGLQRMRRVNEELRRSNTALRDANSKGLADAHLVNTGMMAELEALRADHATTTQELAEISSIIEPILEEAANG